MGEEEASSGLSLVSTYTRQGWKSTEMPRLVTDSGGCANPISFICGDQSWVGLTAVSCQMSLLIHTMARTGWSRGLTEKARAVLEALSACLREKGTWQLYFGN